MENARVEEVFDHAFCKVTKKLVNLELQRTAEGDFEDTDVWERGYREEITTRGCLDSYLAFRFSDGLYTYITSTMNNGVAPSQEEIPLFLNEYVNITCGYAVSALNDMLGKGTKLTVPKFYDSDEPLDKEKLTPAGQYWAYDTAFGTLRVFLFYSLRKD